MKANIVPFETWTRRSIATASMVVLGVMVVEAPADAPVTTPERVTPPAVGAEPVFDSRSHRELWADDFDHAERSIPQGPGGQDSRYGRYVTLGAPHLRFEAGAGIGGSGALRIDWLALGSAPVAGRAGGRCADDSRVLEASFAPSREVIVQYAVRYTRGFVFDWGTRGRCHGNAKKLLLLWARDGSRFVYISENGSLGVGSDHDHPLLQQNRAVAVTPSALADGRWHRLTFHLRQSSAPNRKDGAIHGWIDGVERWSHEGIATHNSGGYVLFKLPATFNEGSPVAQTEWMDDLRVWRPR